MADLKISQLSAATALAGTEVVPVVQGGSTKKATIDQILSPASGKGINFSAAGGDTLTIYDEGTWTPSFSDSGGATPSQTSTGRYTRIGNVVYFWFKCTLAGSATDLYYTTNFPFNTAVTQIAGTAGIGGISDKIYPITAIDDGRLRAFVTATMSAFEGCGMVRL